MSAIPRPLRRAARVLPTPVRRALKRRLGGTPAPAAAHAPAAKPRGATDYPVTPRNVRDVPSEAAVRKTKRRVLDLRLPPAPASDGTPRTIVLDAPASMMIPRLLEKDGIGRYEPYAMDAFLTLLEQAPEGEVLDIGANVGIYGLMASAYSDRKVYAFEPAPDLAQVARSTAEANQLSSLTVEAIALGATTGTATLYLSDQSDASNSLNPNFRPHAHELEIPVETVDSYVARLGIAPAVLKIDTESTEHEVITGALGYIDSHRPWIMCEVLHNRESQLRKVMEPLGYLAYHLDGPGPLEPREEITGDPTHTHFMYLFAPEPVSDEFWKRASAWREALAPA